MNLQILGRFTLVLALLAAFAGCEGEIQHGLTEKDANEIRVVLSQNAIPSDKRKEEGGQTVTWSIAVPKGEVNRATEILMANHLPPDHQPGFVKIYETQGIVPTASEEKGRHLAAIQGEIAQTIESMDGVLSARVNVNIPDVTDLDDRNKKAPTTATVVVSYRRPKNAQGQLEDRPPFSEQKVKMLVSRALPDLTPDNVEVALTPATLPGGDSPGEAYVDIAGLKMSVDSVVAFKTMAAVAILALLALAAWIGMLYYGRGNATPPRPTRSPRGAAPEA
jgi:type III secretion protein J